MKRLDELVAAVRTRYPKDTFFADFAESCAKEPWKRKAYRSYEDALRTLDPDSWAVLKKKATAQFTNHRLGQLKERFFCFLNEAFAYRHLVRRGCTDVSILGEFGKKTPDLKYVEGGELRHCEVKTLGISDDEIARRGSREAHENAYVRLDDRFLNKLICTVEAAREQIQAKRTAGLVYVVVNFDDFALDYYKTYREQILLVCRRHRFLDLHVKVGYRWNRRIDVQAALRGGRALR